MNNKDSGFGIEDKFQRICAKVDLDAILHNVEQMREGLREDTRMIAVIKTDGYGHGSIPIAHCLEPLDYLFGFAVATPEEAYVLREHGVRKPILVLGYTFPYAQERMAREEIRPTIFNLDRSELRELAGIGRAQGKPVRVHIKVDTGMGRIGVTPDDEGLAFVREVMECAADGGLEIEGIFTHFARADERDRTNVRKQLALFTDFLSRVKSELCLDIPLCHCANSAALMELPETNMDAVRAGISLYGLHPSSEVPGEGSYLRPALSLSSHIVHVKTIHAGQSISYGGTFTAGRDMRVATIPVGYGDGYPRSLSGGRGYVLIRGQRAPILGRVCMDQFMADVSDIPEVTRGESVILLGEDGDERITAEMLGDLSGRFNYELVCDLGKRVPRVFYRGGRHVACQDMDGYRTIAANDLCRLQ